MKTVSTSLRLDLRECKTAKDIWDEIQKLHKLERPALRHRVVLELLQLRYKPGDDANKHIDNFTNLVFKAKAAGEQIDDKARCELFLETLPLQLDSVQNKFETSPKAEETFTSLKTIFLNKVNRLNRSRDLEVAEMLYTGGWANGQGHDKRSCGYRGGNGSGSRDSDSNGQGRSTFGGNQKNSGSSGRRKAGDECFYCHKKGHYKQECRKRAKDLKQGRLTRNDNRNSQAEETAYMGTGFGGAVICNDNINDIQSTLLHTESHGRHSVPSRPWSNRAFLW